jgi:hypothetical protein
MASCVGGQVGGTTRSHIHKEGDPKPLQLDSALPFFAVSDVMF